MTEDVPDMVPNDTSEDNEPVTEARPLPDDALLAAIIEPIESAEYSISNGAELVRVDKADLAALAESAHSGGFEMCVDVTATDYKGIRRIRFEVVVNLISHQHNRRLMILAAVAEDDPTVPSLVATYPGTNFFEREVYDMFGITFEGHPDMTRILMPDDWVGHPLRKDFGVGAVPVQFKESPQVQ